ncbi:MAG: aminopeptidase N [Bdellovibrio sp.]|nr:aminopeptidase N [Bdellovibrio sp.]
MNRLLHSCTFLLVLVALAVMGPAFDSAAVAQTTKWVDQSAGSDANDGNTPATAYQTLQFAVDNSTSGLPGTPSVITVKDGTYAATGLTNAGGYSTALLIRNLDYLIVQAAPGHNPVVKPASAGDIVSISIDNCNHLIIENIDSDQTIAQFDNWHVRNSSDLTVRNCTFEGGEDGIDFETSHSTALIEGNAFKNITTGSGDEVLDFTDGSYSGVIIQDNWFDYNYRQITLNNEAGTITGFMIRRNCMDGTNSQEAIRLIGASNVTIENNVVLNSLQQGLYIDTGCSNINVWHNTFFNNQLEQIRNKINSADIVIKNNIFYANGTHAALAASVSPLPGEDFNLIYNQGAQTESGSQPAVTLFGGNTQVGADPMFVSTTAGSEDLHLQEGSPALAAGTDLGVSDDNEKNPRPLPSASNPDLGAYEKGVTAGPCDLYVFLTGENLTIYRTKQTPPAGEIYSNGNVIFERGDPSEYQVNVTAVGNVKVIGSENTIAGAVTAGGTITVGAGSTITGTVSPGAAVSPVPLPALAFSAGGPSYTVPKSGSLSLPPGSYNRVTVNSWFQLSLKEGLTVFRDQEFSADMTDRGVQRIDDVDSLRAGQFAEDAGPNAHPVRPESCLAVDNFFTMTIYEKGSEVIRMMQTIVGRKGFRRGMDEYFKRHDGQAVTTEDFAAAISEPNGKDFSQFKRWYNQAGTPVVSVQEHYDTAKSEYTLTLEQSCPPTPNQPSKEPFHIPLMIGLLDNAGKEMTLDSDKITVNTDGKNLIELKSAKETVTFKGVKERPVLSLLREFSAPVHLKWNAQPDDLYFLMEKDTDSFNRREMAQKIAMGLLHDLIAKARAKQELAVDKRYLAALGATLADESMDPAFKAKMLQLPSYAILAQEEAVLDASAFHAARTALRVAIARENREQLLKIYRKYHGVEPKSRDTKVFGHRALKNQALSLLAELPDSEILEMVNKQYWEAQNMTDSLQALMILADSESAYREKALQHFYDTWKNDSVVINKWFTAQALTHSRKQTLEDVKALTKHPAFNITNPNNVYSLLRAFASNIVKFHDPNSDAFNFYADKIIEVDAKNPQVGARLSAAFNFVAKLDTQMKEKALKEVRRILAVETLSKNSRELLQSTLEANSKV